MVGSVELVSDPRINVDPYRGLVEQKAGEPYSNEKVQASIAALQKTERFSKVEVSVKPDPAGLQVSFVLEPVFYIGVLQFPGAGQARSELMPNLRSFPVGRYLIFYRPIPDGIEVLRVLHGARNLRKIFRR